MATSINCHIHFCIVCIVKTLFFSCCSSTMTITYIIVKIFVLYVQYRIDLTTLLSLSFFSFYFLLSFWLLWGRLMYTNNNCLLFPLYNFYDWIHNDITNNILAPSEIMFTKILWNLSYFAMVDKRVILKENKFNTILYTKWNDIGTCASNKCDKHSKNQDIFSTKNYFRMMCLFKWTF